MFSLKADFAKTSRIAVTATILMMCLHLGASTTAQSSTIVNTNSGKISGVASSDGTLISFKGVPYAAPPVGDLRWRAPKPAAPWSGVLKADHFSRSCMQASPSSLGPWTEEYMDQNERSEDCLYLNVWTESTEGKRPVLVWIHGGGFDQGSTSVALYNGEALARKGIVVVTINYRLGVFGFFAHPELTRESDMHSSGNYGLLDTVAALEWVKANIAGFGGDPARVTIGGQSAGAMAVHALIVSPLAKGLFHGAIAESGSSIANMLLPQADAEKDGVKFQAAKGAGSLKELRAMPVYLLMAPVECAAFRWSPVVDGSLVPDSVSAVIAQGKQNDVATLTGWCADEGSVDPKYGKRTPEEFEREVRRPSVGGPASFFGLIPAGDLADEFLKLYPASTPGKSQIDSARAQKMVSMFMWAAQRAAHSKTPVYTYLWDHPLPGPNRDLYRAFHSSELPYVFNSLAGAKRPWEPADYAIAEKTTSYWANFVKTGNPNGDGLVNWPALDVNTPVTMELGDRFEVRPIADGAQVKLLEEILTRGLSSTGQ